MTSCGRGRFGSRARRKRRVAFALLIEDPDASLHCLELSLLIEALAAGETKTPGQTKERMTSAAIRS
jgi:hypothetical protein